MFTTNKFISLKIFDIKNIDFRKLVSLGYKVDKQDSDGGLGEGRVGKVVGDGVTLQCSLFVYLHYPPTLYASTV